MGTCQKQPGNFGYHTRTDRNSKMVPKPETRRSLPDGSKHCVLVLVLVLVLVQYRHAATESLLSKEKYVEDGACAHFMPFMVHRLVLQYSREVSELGCTSSSTGSTVPGFLAGRSSVLVP